MDLNNALPGNGKPSSFRCKAVGPSGGIDAFDAAEAAPEFKPIPPGVYSARVLRGEYCTTKKDGADAYRLRFEIIEGPQAGQTLIRTWTFGKDAINYTKRDLAPFGLTTLAKLLSPFPEAGKEYLVRLVVAMQRRNDGIDGNDIKKIDVLRVTESPDAAFKLPEQGEGGSK